MMRFQSDGPFELTGGELYGYVTLTEALDYEKEKRDYVINVTAWVRKIHRDL